MEKMSDAEVLAKGADYWRDVLQREGLLHQMVDYWKARVIECERLKQAGCAPTVVESEAARKLREKLHALNSMERDGWCSRLAFPHSGYVDTFHDALRTFCETAPPTSASVREVVVESPEATKLREAWAKADARGREDVCDWPTNVGGKSALGSAIIDFCESAPPASATSDELRRQLSDSLDREARLRAKMESRDAERLAQLAGYQDRAMRAEEELAALKSAPQRAEREVDRELREALTYSMHWADEGSWNNNPARRTARALKAWLSTPLAAAQKQDEYTKGKSNNESVGLQRSPVQQASVPALAPDEGSRPRNAIAGVARSPHSRGITEDQGEHLSIEPAGAAQAPAQRYRLIGPDGQPVNKDTYTEQDRASGELKDGYTWEPAQDGERVTLYVRLDADGAPTGALFSDSESRDVPLKPGERWIAFGARVVQEGGA